MEKFGFYLTVVIFGLGFCGPVAAQATPAPCSVDDLSLALDDEEGEFEGMSQSGTLLVLRNIGPDACQLPARPTVVLEDANKQPAPVSLRTSPGMHPGPALSPIVLPRGAEATAEMHWVSGDVWSADNCVTPAFLVVQIGEDRLRTSFGRQICGPAGQHPQYDLAVFKTDPVYLSADTVGQLLPAGIEKIVSGYGDQCLRLGAALPSGDRPRMMTADLDGDGKPDFVLNPDNLRCAAAATAYCGNGGCNITVALSRDNYGKPTTIMGGQPTIVQKEGGTDLEVWVSRSNCKSADRTRACWAILSWKDGKASTQYQSRRVEAE